MLTMDYFGSQDQAKKRTRVLVVLFVVIVIAIVLLMCAVFTLLLMLASSYITIYEPEPQAYLWLWKVVGTFTVCLIAWGTIRSWLDLRKGGFRVAKLMGGILVSPETEDPAERRLLNVVEEMSIASGCPMPDVYVMQNEKSINAFAAGMTTDTAVIGVTRGAMLILTRDELQGVVAHEYSHILNGDMLLNVRMISLIRGLTMVSTLGLTLIAIGLAAMENDNIIETRHDDNRGFPLLGLVLWIIGGIIYIVGSLGVLGSSVLKAAVSRQREHLADASAVQFTRYADGIAGALKKIGGYEKGGMMKNAHASEVNHAFFCSGVSKWVESVKSTHPPLADRIYRVLPKWDGFYTNAHFPMDGRMVGETDESDLQVRLKKLLSRGQDDMVSGVKNAAQQMITGGAIASETMMTNHAETTATNTQTGEIQETDNHEIEDWYELADPDDEHTDLINLDTALLILASLPGTLVSAAHHSDAAEAIIFALVYDHRNEEARAKQDAIIKNHNDPRVRDAFNEHEPYIAKLDTALRLPLMDISLNALRSMNVMEYHQFRDALTAFIQADGRIDLLEWVIGKCVITHLDPIFGLSTDDAGRGKRTLKHEAQACSVLISTLARTSSKKKDDVMSAFKAAANELQYPVNFLPSESCGLHQLEQALKRLRHVRLNELEFLIKACAKCLWSDGKVTTREAELYRAITSLMGVTMPPLYASQSERNK